MYDLIMTKKYVMNKVFSQKIAFYNFLKKRNRKDLWKGRHLLREKEFEKGWGQLFGPRDFGYVEVELGNVGQLAIVILDTLLVTFWCLKFYFLKLFSIFLINFIFLEIICIFSQSPQKKRKKFFQ